MAVSLSACRGQCYIMATQLISVSIQMISRLSGPALATSSVAEPVTCQWLGPADSDSGRGAARARGTAKDFFRPGLAAEKKHCVTNLCAQKLEASNRLHLHPSAGSQSATSVTVNRGIRICPAREPPPPAPRRGQTRPGSPAEAIACRRGPGRQGGHAAASYHDAILIVWRPPP
jgi:hypothetical protein